MGSASLFVLAGCTTSQNGGDGDSGVDVAGPSDTDGDGVPDDEDDFPDDAQRSAVLSRFSERDELNEDYYQFFEFSFPETTGLEYTVEVEGDVHLDVIVTDQTNFRYYKDGTEWEYMSGLSDLETTYATEGGWLEAGEWVLIIDNTDAGGAAPPMNLENDRVGYSVEGVTYR